MTSLRIALVVHGRFHIFDLARELLHQGHDVTLFTNYPKRVCERFGVPRRRVVNCLTHGVASRALAKLLPRSPGLRERWTNAAFGRWAARTVPAHGRWDAVACMSGVAEDLFDGLDAPETLRVLLRLSLHIREQKRILAEEERAGGRRVEQPSDWIVAREEREYERADLIQVLAPFSLDSFVRAGVPREKLDLIYSAVNVSAFRPPAAVVEARLQRLTAGERLRVICAGTFCRRKGARFWGEMLEGASQAAQFRFVGSIASDAAGIARSIGARAEFRAKVPEASLREEYAWADLFALPTLEEGSPAVVAQALASRLPVITTTSCGASALVENGLTGWIIPPSRSDALADCVRRLDADRAELVAAVRRLREREFSRDWSEYARDFVRSIRDRREAT
ncbi:MAG TPA: glycosyltransferase family 4 protein [Pirellulales bacterium]|nr:glycosyltransferase family 4 protein [Pirellulales bacterium]